MEFSRHLDFQVTMDMRRHCFGVLDLIVGDPGVEPGMQPQQSLDRGQKLDQEHPTSIGYDEAIFRSKRRERKLCYVMQ